VSFAIQLALDLRLREMTDRALMGDRTRGELVVSHKGYLLNDPKDVLRLASRRPTFQISPHMTQRQYDATVTTLLVVLMSSERQAGQAVGGAVMDVLTSLRAVLCISRIYVPLAGFGTEPSFAGPVAFKSTPVLRRAAWTCLLA
jgi:hypothetical protein